MQRTPIITNPVINLNQTPPSNSKEMDDPKNRRISWSWLIFTLPFLYVTMRQMGYTSIAGFSHKAMTGLCLVYPEMPICPSLSAIPGYTYDTALNQRTYRSDEALSEEELSQALQSFRQLVPTEPDFQEMEKPVYFVPNQVPGVALGIGQGVNPDGTPSNQPVATITANPYPYGYPYYYGPPLPPPIFGIGPGFYGFSPYYSSPYYFHGHHGYATFQNHDTHHHRLTHHHGLESTSYLINPGDEITIPMPRQENQPHFIVDDINHKLPLEFRFS